MKGAILIIGMVFAGILLFGCTGQTAQTQNATLSNGCTTLYDGTWKGVIADSGSLEVTRYDANGVAYITHNPFTAQYNFEMTIKCSYGDEKLWGYEIPYVKASHPIFDCANGCVPLGHQPGQDNLDVTNAYINKNGSGLMYILFPNGALIQTFVEDGRLKASPDGKTIELYISGDMNDFISIGWTGYQEGTKYRDIETDNCVRLGGEGDCWLEYINKNTIILTKVS